jgi:hypothetical protein
LKIALEIYPPPPIAHRRQFRIKYLFIDNSELFTTIFTTKIKNELLDSAPK